MNSRSVHPLRIYEARLFLIEEGRQRTTRCSKASRFLNNDSFSLRFHSTGAEQVEWNAKNGMLKYSL